MKKLIEMLLLARLCDFCVGCLFCGLFLLWVVCCASCLLCGLFVTCGGML